MGSRFGKGYSGVGAYQMLRIMADILSLHVHYGNRTLSEIEGGHYGVLDPLFVLGRRLQTVHDKFDEMGLIPVKCRHFIEFMQLAVYPDLGVSAFAQLFEKFLVMSLSSAHKRCHQVALAVLVALHYQGHDLLVAVSDHLGSGFRRVGLGCLGVEQTKEIVDLGDRAHSGTRVVSRCLLFYGDDRTQSCNGFYIRLFQYAHEMLCIGGEGIHIPPLSFRIYRVERKR